MKGLAHSLFLRLQQKHGAEPFGFAVLLMEARLIPKAITPELDDPDLEQRLLTLLQGKKST